MWSSSLPILSGYLGGGKRSRHKRTYACELSLKNIEMLRERIFKKKY